MINKSTSEVKYLNCFSDLQRAAVTFYLNPQGKNHQIFLKHSQQILDKMKNPLAKKFSVQIRHLKQKTTFPSGNRGKIINLADQILTLGLLLKGKSKFTC